MIDTRQLVSQLRMIESVALISRVSSTNELARRILDECIENELPLPSAMIVAREQLAGHGRGERTWHSPRDAGIYATLLHTRKLDEVSTLPLLVAVAVVCFLRDTFAIDAGIKWPNDILVARKKIAGILIEARSRNTEAYVAIGIGVNIAPAPAEQVPAATSISEVTGRPISLDEATLAFIRAMDAELGRSRPDVVSEWSSLSIHRAGDPVRFNLPSGEVAGTWERIDPFGRAVVRTESGLQQFSAADLVLAG